ncbi:hypothetical protein IAQ61_005832 [Plenodomus lingam]|uniref:uncharacterized protein n=1 Tax=Leptosphaeria maculans TaxID=5022 RepID=UPI00332AAFD5|nr:hypothetical protein IAQ61_005832 [Plenodomus lingam]
MACHIDEGPPSRKTDELTAYTAAKPKFPNLLLFRPFSTCDLVRGLRTSPRTMFAADLTWAEHGTEKVGERRERKERQRTTPASSIKTSNSSKGSTNPERELWWTSGLRKAKGMKPKLSVLRPKTGRSSTSENTERRTSRPQSLVDFGHGDQIIQPGWTCPSTLPPPQSRDESPESEVPELEGDVSSRYTDSTEPQHLCRSTAAQLGSRSRLKSNRVNRWCKIRGEDTYDCSKY